MTEKVSARPVWVSLPTGKVMPCSWAKDLSTSGVSLGSMDSAITATKRPVAGGWGFGGDNSAPIEAAALALWGAKTSKRDPNRVMRIG